MVKDTIEKARTEYDSGNYWRAKEIVQSSLDTYGYNIELYSLYGSVLLAMQDKMQAGKYCFLAKENLNELEREAVELYLERHAKKGYTGILASFPVKSRLKKLANYPEFVQNRLNALGAKENLFSFPDRLKTMGRFFSFFGCLVVFLVIAICCIVGLVTVIKWLF